MSEEKVEKKLPRLPSLENNETLKKMLPMPPEEGPPLPRILKLKWPWVKK
jgi:hypothetical protein